MELFRNKNPSNITIETNCIESGANNPEKNEGREKKKIVKRKGKFIFY